MVAVVLKIVVGVVKTNMFAHLVASVVFNFIVIKTVVVKTVHFKSKANFAQIQIVLIKNFKYFNC